MTPKELEAALMCLGFTRRKTFTKSLSFKCPKTNKLIVYIKSKNYTTINVYVHTDLINTYKFNAHNRRKALNYAIMEIGNDK